jgi:hypothetical protein
VCFEGVSVCLRMCTERNCVLMVSIRGSDDKLLFPDICFCVCMWGHVRLFMCACICLICLCNVGGQGC